MKNRQKSRSGCRTCKLRRVPKPGCRNCAQKGFECPGYQQRLQWSTKHERPTTTKTSGPANFTQLVTAASESIVSKPATAVEASSQNGTNASAVVPVTERLTVPSVALSTSSSPWTSASPSSSSSSSTPSPPPQYEDPTTSAVTHAALVPAVAGVVPKAEPGLPKEPGQVPDMTMFQPVVDMPTFLIEHWFKSVCTSWSALDSPSNPYRRLTEKYWQTSRPVFYALQAISAASLVERLPHVMKDTARAVPGKATEAIGKELVAFHAGFRSGFPTALLLSLFCMSSSMCWMEARQLGQQFVRQARAVLKVLDGWTLDSESRELLDFFKGCLVYEEMLRSVVSDEEADIEHMLSWPEPATQRPLAPVVPHAWSGVSSDILKLFGKAIALCRRSRTRWRHNDGTSYRILQGAMRDIEEATQLEESLRLIDIPQLPKCNQAQQTTDRTRDLHNLTDAYRLCALLQLYETFPDLSTKRIPALKDADGSVVWHSWVSPFALHVTDVLHKVPAGSLSCIQPLLCLCAGSGLRYDSKVPLGSGPHTYLLSTGLSAPALPTPPGPTDPDFHSLHHEISENAVKTSRARQFIMDRLDQLELTLPPKPIGVAKQLLRAVWSAYDEEIGLPRRTHWVDVMSHTGLHSLFG
ncbi:fungal-specific transcription factor domain-containing protein [Chaetomidium leptoderma]|uniref:Fungal-specific transcription factor domain-containing protein n=1 Tax=Chaetomidium leptoderma TaxID=669021 RepID=A0AAN6ZTN5_9PEZI|nr:fungal-specific transcription factor domain-containing protein [Chaetomidium leptoderma]